MDDSKPIWKKENKNRPEPPWTVCEQNAARQTRRIAIFNFSIFLKDLEKKKYKIRSNNECQIHISVGQPILGNLFEMIFLYICFSICWAVCFVDYRLYGKVKWKKVEYTVLKQRWPDSFAQETILDGPHFLTYHFYKWYLCGAEKIKNIFSMFGDFYCLFLTILMLLIYGLSRIVQKDSMEMLEKVQGPRK